MHRAHTSPAAAIAASVRAAGLPRKAQLRNGVAIRIRPVRPDDARRFNAFICKLSVASRGCRFHGDIGAIGDCAPATLQRLVAADGVRQVAFIATLPCADGEEVIGEARYCVGADADRVELAITVADAWQGQGMADLLLDSLLEAARDAGVRWIYGEVGASNTRMIGFLHRMGFQTCAQGSGHEVVRIERGVAPRLPRAGQRPAGALRRWLLDQFASLA